MDITPMTDDLDIIAALSDTPNDSDGMTAGQLKAKFDEAGNTIKSYINDSLLPDIAQAVADAEMHEGNIPAGGTTGQALIKTSDDDYDATWHDVVGVSAATPSSLMARDENGNTSVAMPTAAEHAANRGYVDSFASASLIRDLNIMLNLAFATTNTNAWADLLADTTRIDTGASSGYKFAAGSIMAKIEQATTSNQTYFGHHVQTTWFAQTFTAIATGNIPKIKVDMYVQGNPTDAITMQIYSTAGGFVAAPLYTATNTVSKADIMSGNTIFSFNDAAVVAGTMYAFVIKRTGAIDSSNYYTPFTANDTAYTGGTVYAWNGSSWAAHSCDFKFLIYNFPVTIVWNAVTATEVLSHVAVATKQVLNSGTVTWYVSNNGTVWTQITALNTAQAVTWATTSVYIKCVITGDSELRAVGWGGY